MELRIAKAGCAARKGSPRKTAEHHRKGGARWQPGKRKVCEKKIPKLAQRALTAHESPMSEQAHAATRAIASE
jgi:hypothetical protein